jgi:FG-GAP repeat
MESNRITFALRKKNSLPARMKITKEMELFRKLLVHFATPFIFFCTLTGSVVAANKPARDPHVVPTGLTASDWNSIQVAHEAQRYAVTPGEAGYRAHNPGQQWHIEFDGRGFLTRPLRDDWRWGLELRSYGFAGNERSVEQTPRAAKVDGQRMTYEREENVQEWFINDNRGLEHGFTIQERPLNASDPEAPLVFTLAVRGNLHPIISGSEVRFVDNQGVIVVMYAKLKAWDASGKSLPARFLTSNAGVTLSVDERGAQYPITIDPIAQQAYLKASNTEANDFFGAAVAISGDTVVVGAYGEDSAATGVNGNQANNSVSGSGAAYVFVRSGNTWTQQAYLKASNTGANDLFGASVGISGNTVVVGAYGEDSAATGVNGNQVDNSAAESGAAYVFVRSGSTWTQQAYLKASNTGAGDFFGEYVAISGDTVVIGAPSESSAATGVNGNQADNSATESGAAYVFVRSGSTWTQQAYLKASNTEAHDFFGRVTISGDTVVVGASSEDSAATGVNGNQADNSAFGSGAAYVFVRSGSTWTQQAYLKASNTEASDGFGGSVGISGDTVVVGAAGEDSAATGVNGNQVDNSAAESGAAYVFVRSGSTWTQQAYLKASSTGASDAFGGSAGISGDTVVVGAAGEDSAATGVNGNQVDNSATESGAAYVFVRSGSTWTQQAYLKASNTEANDFFFTVAISGDTAVVGAYGEDSAATGVNGNQTSNAATDSGAAYVFNGLPATGPLQNISTRAEVLTGAKVLIGGFVLSGTGTKQVLMRGLGPTLTDFGITGALADPTLELHDAGGGLITSNDNWKETQEAAIQATGKAPTHDSEAAILQTLAPGNYTAILAGKNNTSGVGLVEVYDQSATSGAELSNISSRGQVGTGNDVMIGGFVSAVADTRVIVRALGPTLTQFGVTGALADPVLGLFDANGNAIASNDNWQQSTQAAQIQSSGFAPPNALEPAIISTRPLGNTTAIVSGKNGTTGVAVVEVYLLP